MKALPLTDDEYSALVCARSLAVHHWDKGPQTPEHIRLKLLVRTEMILRNGECAPSSSGLIAIFIAAQLDPEPEQNRLSERIERLIRRRLDCTRDMLDALRSDDYSIREKAPMLVALLLDAGDE